MRSPHPPLVTVLLLAFTPGIGGCGAEEAADRASRDGGGADPGVLVRDSAGIEIVESERPAWSEDEAWRLADTPSVRIGVVDGDPAYQFDGIAGVVRAPDGRIAVADGGSRQIRVYDLSGQHVRTFGGEGAGPGEFGRMAGMVGRGDTLVVFDPAAGRLSPGSTSRVSSSGPCAWIPREIRSTRCACTGSASSWRRAWS